MHIDDIIKKITSPNPAVAPYRREPINVNTLMQCVREEVARRQRGSRAGQGAPLGLGAALPRWRPSLARLPQKSEYVLAELLAYSDSDFVENCYRIVLRREPDLAGLEFHANRLRSGLASKVEILGEIRFSTEGRRNGVHIDGLLLPYKLHHWMRIPGIGRALRWLHTFTRLDALGWRQQVLDSAQAREAQHTGYVVNALSEAVEIQLDSLASTVDANGVDTQNALGNLGDKLDSLQEEVSGLATEVAGINARMAELMASMQARIEEIDPRLAAFEASMESLYPQVAVIQGTLALLGTRVASLEAAAQAPDPHALDTLYADFEDEFRGPREIVRQRVEQYLPLVREAGAGTEQAPVLDLGCGRGEWLELLRDNGLHGRGIDLNTLFVDGCRRRGLDVELGDVLESLARIPDSSIGAITSMHLVEHLPYEGLIALIDAAHRVLRPGGLLILETPNPENFQVGACWFYLDPSHRNPIPPAALRWTVEARGFGSARIERLTQHRDMQGPPRVSDDVPGAVSINAVSDMFMAPLDYAIVAMKA